jgi:hypothetical protein
MYQSPFKDWQSGGTVHKPVLNFDFEPELLLFPPQLVPGLDHPLTQKLTDEAKRRLTLRTLESYLRFTEDLEYDTLVPAAKKLAQQPEAFGLGKEAGRDARLLMTDEAHHAFVAAELMHRIPGLSDLPTVGPSRSRFLRGLEILENRLPSNFRDDLLIGFVSVSETLITGILFKVPRDRRIVTAVRENIRDHAIDECRHHTLFIHVVQQHWASCGSDRKEILGPTYATLIRLFLDPDFDLIRLWLLEAGLDCQDVETVLRDCYSPTRMAASLRADARATLNLMKRVGVLDHPASRAAFVEQGFID